ncbi:MAG: DEAD/DEAH box helicase [Fimbriimonadaceae bacterium]|nr:DEAD/DEAH box helicase [Fimbriimonadaceae bacterium]
MDVFDFRQRLVSDYETFTRSFVRIKAPDIKGFVDSAYAAGAFWPSPLIQLNPAFVSGGDIGAFVAEGLLHPECERIFRFGKSAEGAPGRPLLLHKHQEEAIRIAKRRESYVLTTGTGSGKSLSYFIPIVDDVLRRKAAGEAKGITAIVVYPMNALANSQMEELEKYICLGYHRGGEPVRFARYTGQESQTDRDAIAANPPDILLTNYVMLELLLTRHSSPDPQIVQQAQGLRFLVLDELHTYRGRQGADVAMLVRRVRDRMNPDLLCVGTSATMATEGLASDKATVVARVASRLFGANVSPANVVTETLRRVTPDSADISTPSLARAIDAGVPVSAGYEELRSHSISAWIETTLGLAREDNKPDGKWVRAPKPKTVEEASELLARESGRPLDQCSRFLRSFLLASYNAKNANGVSLFAFRLHQFVTGAGDLFTTLEKPQDRFLTVNGQQFKPGDRSKPLFTACFCRSCGQEYLPVWMTLTNKKPTQINPREFGERSGDEEGASWGYFMPDPSGSFDPNDMEVYPAEWMEPDQHGGARLRRDFRRYQPVSFSCTPEGEASAAGLSGWIVPGSFRFCLAPDCHASFDGSVRSEGSKLGSLSAEGRSSATTVLALSAMRFLISQDSLPDEAKKLLAFSDNRQDASLQAGHLNDFVMILLLRGALLAALRDSGSEGLRDDHLTHQVFDHLHLTPQDYASNPEAKGAKAEGAKRALRDVLGYRLYFDLRRGWRFTHPNLEQLGFLEIGYSSLDDCAKDEDEWSTRHPLLAAATPAVRKDLLRSLLDIMRRGLCIKTVYLDPDHQETARNRSYSDLKDPWGYAEDERPLSSAIMVPRPESAAQKDALVVNVSHRSVFGRRVRAKATWKDAISRFPAKIDEDAYNAIADDMLAVLQVYGLVEPVEIKRDLTGFQVPSSTLEWREGSTEKQADANPFFRDLYDNVAEMLRQNDRLLHVLHAREHTAQVDADEREKREAAFRTAKLPVMFCSPTMELGVDISTLNTVYMRNVPPTPANYAQRSGRAGRSGQPALVLTYCAARSPHDQYFFRDPSRMVAGAVSPPAIDLANEDLIRSHIHAVWLAETGAKLGPSVRQVIDTDQDDKLPIIEQIALQIDQPSARVKASARAINILGTLRTDLTQEAAPWFTQDWLDHTIRSSHLTLNSAFDRWRDLLRATLTQMKLASAIDNNLAADQKTKKDARQRLDEARMQRDLLLDSGSSLNSDFYAYRYLASEGFLPGYNFPRLPLLAYIPARRERAGRESFLSRPRFLGLSEFGPRSIIYHEGSTYRVRKAILTLRSTDTISADSQLPVRKARRCPACGYGHFDAESEYELCVACGSRLDGDASLLSKLYRIDQVSTRRADRINSDEEERQRQGYEIVTTLRFADQASQRRVSKIEVSEGGECLLEADYGPAATVWRINLGWRRRKAKSIYGFLIDVATGDWAKDEQAPEERMDDAPTSRTVERIIPFVEDRRNILVVRPRVKLSHGEITTFMFALKRGIESLFQLEESELAAEPLPDSEHRHAILLYEAAEGGAGVLNRLASDLTAMRRVAQRALEVMHFGPRTGAWVSAAAIDDQDPNCEAGCYRCLLSYSNQPDHTDIDRRNETVLDLLCRLTRADASIGSSTGATAEDAFAVLHRMAGSGLERKWLEALRDGGYRLPDRAQPMMSDFGTQPDFAYDATKSIIYIDGPHHQHASVKLMDDVKRTALRNAGYKVIEFGSDPNGWKAVLERYSFVFGKPNA